MGSLVAELAEKLSSATNNFDIDEGTMYVNTSADTVGIGTTNPASKLDVQGTMQVGVNDTGHDVKFFGATAGAYLEWDESADELEIRGGAATPGKLLLSTAEPSVVDGNKLGQIDFQAPLDATGGTSADQRLVAASIWAEADATFSATVNDTDLVFATGLSETAAEKMRITSDGKVGIGTTAPETTLHVGNTASGTGGSTGKPIIVASTLATVYDGTSSNSWQGLKVSNSDGTSNRTATGITFDHRTSSSGVAAIMSTSAAADRGDLRFITRGSDGVNERMIIDDAGNVGIGISDPSHLLHVQQTAATGMGMLVVRNKNSDNSDSPLAKFHNDNISDDQTALHVRQDSPGYAIHVECNTDTTNYGNGIAISTQDENTTSYPLYIGTNTTSVEAGNARFVVRADGNVGIGTSAPSSLLEVSKSSDASEIRASAWSTTNAHSGTIVFTKSASATQGTYAATADGEQLGAIQAYGSESGNGISAASGAILFQQDGAAASGRVPSRIAFYTGSGTANQDEKMRITQEGKVGIGTNAPPVPLCVEGAGAGGNGLVRFNCTDGTGTPEGLLIDYTNTTPDDTGWSYYFQDSTAGRFIVRNDGDVQNHDNSYSQLSDVRIKQGIRDANSQWDDVKAVRVRNFTRKDDAAQYGDKAWEQIGVIAQEVEKISPKLIKENPPGKFELEHCGFGEQNEDGEWVPKKDENGKDMTVKSMKYSILQVKAFKALQEAMAKIETLEAKVTALENA